MTSTGDATGVVSYAPQPDQTEFSAMPINTTTQLSPQAQAVLNAANNAQSYHPDDCLNEARAVAAAALRAAADQLGYGDGSGDPIINEHELLAIADELYAE